MKKLLLISILVAAFTSCSSTDDTPILSEEKGGAITFGKLETRAAVNDASDINEFGVFAEKSNGAPGTEGASQYTNILANEKVYRNPDNTSKWIYDNPQYWVYDRIFHFFATYPYENRIGRKPERATLTQLNDTKEYVGYKVPFVVPETANTDLLFANKEVVVAPYPTEFQTVDLNFEHALSKISIKATKNSANLENKIIVKKITLTGMWKTGTYYFSPDTAYQAHWDFYGATTFEIMGEGNWTIESAANTTPMLLDGLLLMPQEIGLESILVTLTYDYYTDPNKAEPFEANLVAEKFIPRGEWLPTTQYVYTLELSAVDNQIKFGTPKITPWGNPQSGGTVIIQ